MTQRKATSSAGLVVRDFTKMFTKKNKQLEQLVNSGTVVVSSSLLSLLASSQVEDSKAIKNRYDSASWSRAFSL